MRSGLWGFFFSKTMTIVLRSVFNRIDRLDGKRNGALTDAAFLKYLKSEQKKFTRAEKREARRLKAFFAKDKNGVTWNEFKSAAKPKPKPQWTVSVSYTIAPPEPPAAKNYKVADALLF